MKKLYFSAFLLMGFISFAQHEAKLNITDALALKTLHISYEQYISHQTSLGASALFNFEGSSSDFRYNEDRAYTGYVRHYLSSDNMWNLFGELFFTYATGQDNDEDITTEFSGGALGLAVGYKYISKGGFTIGPYIGAGRYLFGEDTPTVIPRIGLNIGFQF